MAIMAVRSGEPSWLEALAEGKDLNIPCVLQEIALHLRQRYTYTILITIKHD